MNSYDPSKYHRFLKKIPSHSEIKQICFYKLVTDIYYYNAIDGFLSFDDTINNFYKELGYDFVIFYKLNHGFYFVDKDMEEKFISKNKIVRKGSYRAQRSKLDNNISENNKVEELPSLNTYEPLEAFHFINNEFYKTYNNYKIVCIFNEIGLIIDHLISNNLSDRSKLFSIILSWRDNNHNEKLIFFTTNIHDVNELPEIIRSVQPGYKLCSIENPEMIEKNRILSFLELNLPLEEEKIKRNLELLSTQSLREIKGILLDYIKLFGNDLNYKNLNKLIYGPKKNYWSEVNKNLDIILNKLNTEIIGQSIAKKRFREEFLEIQKKIKNLDEGIVDRKPLCTFFFVGPSGVGKTEFFRFMERHMRGISFMSFSLETYTQEVDVEKLWGAPPSFRGDPQGELGKFLLANPQSIILFDEFDRCHPKIIEKFLGLFEGNLTTGDGISVNLSECIFILTSNIGSDKMINITEDMTESEINKIGNDNIKIASEELLIKTNNQPLKSRLEANIIPFTNLLPQDIEKIIESKITFIKNENSEHHNTSITLDSNVVEYFKGYYRFGYDTKSGVRGIVNYIYARFKTPLNYLLSISRDKTNFYINNNFELNSVKDDESIKNDRLNYIGKETFYRLNPWQKFLNENIGLLKETLLSEIKGQDEGISRFIEIFEDISLNLNKDNILKPLGFVFLAGPTGVGKSETFNILKKVASKDGKIKFTEFDMSDYSERHNISGIFGTSPGYVGFDSNPDGEFGKFIRANHSTCILFDEFEKADKETWNKFLGILEGKYKTYSGNLIDLSQSFFIFTSNIASNNLETISEDAPEEHRKKIIESNHNIINEALFQMSGKREIVGRLTNYIIPYNNLTTKQLNELVIEKIHGLSIELNVELHKSINNYILSKTSKNIKYGFRPFVAEFKSLKAKIEKFLLRTPTESGKIIYIDKKGQFQISNNDNILDFFTNGK